MMGKIKILVACHDPGGANILASLVSKYRKNFQWLICSSGPAKAIFSLKNFNSYPNIQFIKYNNAHTILVSFQPNLVLTGTGWESNFENLFLKEAKKVRIKTIAFLDHWACYQERFGNSDDWEKNLPDYIFVGDKWAYKIALKDGFLKNKLIQVENPYFEEMIKQANKIKKNKIIKNQNKKIKILYISQPILKHAVKKYNNPIYWGYTEYEVTKDLLKMMKLKENKTLLEFKIRLHPAEKLDKYTSLLKNKNYQKISKLVSISRPVKNSLVMDCMWADIVIGSGSMALVIALLIGKKTISYVPTEKQTCDLPQKEIKKIYTYEKLFRTLDKLKIDNNLRVKKISNYNYAINNSFAQEIKKLI